jgi:hypothetical protein
MIRERLNADILAPITDVELDVRLTHLPLSRGGGGFGGLGCGFGFSAMLELLSFVLFDVLCALGANCERIREMFGFDGDDCLGCPGALGAGAIGKLAMCSGAKPGRRLWNWRY